MLAQIEDRSHWTSIAACKDLAALEQRKKSSHHPFATHHALTWQANTSNCLHIDTLGDEDMIATWHEITRGPTGPSGVVTVPLRCRLGSHGLVGAAISARCEVRVDIACSRRSAKLGKRPKDHWRSFGIASKIFEVSGVWVLIVATEWVATRTTVYQYIHLWFHRLMYYLCPCSPSSNSREPRVGIGGGNTGSSSCNPPNGAWPLLLP